MNAETLKPCPFCGKTPAFSDYGDNDGPCIRIEHWCTDIMGMFIAVEEDTKEQSAVTWNTRAADNIALQAEVERLRDLLSKCVVILDATMEESKRSIEYDEEDSFRMGEWFEADDMIALEAARAASTEHPNPRDLLPTWR